MNAIFTPHNDKILLRPIVAETTTASGLVVPAAKETQTEFGDVVSVGPGRVLDASAREGKVERLSPLVKPGDRVLFNKYSALPVSVAGEDLFVISEFDVLGVLSFQAMPAEVGASVEDSTK